MERGGEGWCLVIEDRTLNLYLLDSLEVCTCAYIIDTYAFITQLYASCSWSKSML